jgi:hypothetical protein
MLIFFLRHFLCSEEGAQILVVLKLASLYAHTHFDFNLFIACARSAKIIHYQLLMACAVVNKNKQEHAKAHTST